MTGRDENGRWIAAEITPALLAEWPNCWTIDCPNKRCMWSGTSLCFKCAEHELGHAEIVRRYNATHPDCEPMT